MGRSKLIWIKFWPFNLIWFCYYNRQIILNFLNYQSLLGLIFWNGLLSPIIILFSFWIIFISGILISLKLSKIILIWWCFSILKIFILILIFYLIIERWTVEIFIIFLVVIIWDLPWLVILLEWLSHVVFLHVLMLTKYLIVLGIIRGHAVMRLVA